MIAGKSLDIIVPVYNECEVVPLFHAELCDVLGHVGLTARVIYVNDGSTDGTEQALTLLKGSLAVQTLSFSKNYGKEMAILAGIDVADADAVVVMDADLQHPPRLLPDLISLWNEGYEIVQGVRCDNLGSSVPRKLASAAFYHLLSTVTRIDVPTNLTDFCLMDRLVVDVIRQHRERRRMFRILLTMMGFRSVLIPFEAPKRVAGTTKFSGRKLVAYAADSITAMSTAPLYMSFALGVLMFLLAVSEGLYSVAVHMFHFSYLPGWASIVGWIALFEGAGLMMTGIVGLYLARVFEEVRGGPLYTVCRRESTAPASGRAAIGATRANLVIPDGTSVGAAVSSSKHTISSVRGDLLR